MKQRLQLSASKGGNKGISLPIDVKPSSSASTNLSSTSKQNDKNRSELFHVRVITNHTKIDTLFDTLLHFDPKSDGKIRRRVDFLF